MEWIEETTKLNKKQIQHLEAKAIADKQIRYREALTLYGIIPYLMTLERFETEERYNECQLITDTIKRANLTNSEKYPLKFVNDYCDSDVKLYSDFVSVRSRQCYNFLLQIEPKYKPPLVSCI